MIKKFKGKVKSLSHFLWLILLIIVSIFVTFFYESNQKKQYENLKKTLNNIYLQKTLKKITSGLEDRYTEYEYIVKEGDNYESIVNLLKIPKNEKNLFLKIVKKKQKNKNIKTKSKNLF